MNKNKKLTLCLREIMDERNITRYQLAKRAEIHYPTIDRYYKNKTVRYDNDVLLKICLDLDCDISDILKIVDADAE